MPLRAPEIPDELAKAFHQAVFAYPSWKPGTPEPEITFERKRFSLTDLCGLADRFTDSLSQHALIQLYSYMREPGYEDLKRVLVLETTYAAGARCFRRLIDRRKEEAQRRQREDVE